MATKQTFKKTSHSFYEKQRYRNLPVLLLLLAVEAVLVYLILQEIMADNLWGAKKLKSWSLITFTVLVPTPLLLSFLFVRLDTYISEEGIFYRWVPFRSSFHMIMWDNIREISLIDIKKSGGRWKVTKGMNEVQYPGGRFGMVISMKSGRKRFITSRKAEEMNSILKRLSGGKYQAQQAEGLFSYD
jgi:hypothetical protein